MSDEWVSDYHDTTPMFGLPTSQDVSVKLDFKATSKQ